MGGRGVPFRPFERREERESPNHLECLLYLELLLYLDLTNVTNLSGIIALQLRSCRAGPLSHDRLVPGTVGSLI